ncbi:MAG: SRPBCC domain-containing protein [Acidobacteriota bacterium]
MNEYTQPTDDRVLIERTFDAPLEVVWRLWTDPEHFKAWYGPAGARVPVAEMDVRVGGARLVCMEMDTPNGPMQMWFAGEFLEVEAPRRLVYTDSFADEAGRLKSAAEMGMPEGTPTTTEVIVQLEASAERTKMTLTHVGVPADSPGASGWNAAFDKLGAHAATVTGTT